MTVNFFIYLKIIFEMNVNKEVYLDWFKSDNKTIACKAMERQLAAVLYEIGRSLRIAAEKEQKLSGMEKFFTFDELLATNGDLTAQAISGVSRGYPELFPVLLGMLREESAKGRKIPVSVYTEIIGVTAYHLEDESLRRVGLDFVAELQLENQKLYKEIGSLLRCVERMPELKEVALSAVRRAEGVNFCTEIYGFLTQWGCLCDESCEILQEAFKYIVPEWAPLMIEGLTTCPGKYRYRLSLALFREYFPTQGEAVLKKILLCLADEGNVELQKVLIGELFDFMSEQEKSDEMLAHIVVFLDGLSYWIRYHWGFVADKMIALWEKYDRSPVFFRACRKAFVNDETLIAVQEKEDRSVLEVLTAEEAAHNPDLYLLLIKFLQMENLVHENLVKSLLAEARPAFVPQKPVDAAILRLDGFLNRFWNCSNRYLTDKYVCRFITALVAGGEVEDVGRAADFFSSRNLNIPVFEEKYAVRLKALADKKAEEAEVLAYLES